jgi:hypothetical protein
MTADDAKTVTIGTAIVSYIEPHPGHEIAFNHWYERDHFPATVRGGPGVFAGARFIATRACKALRPPGQLFGDPARGSHLAVAWVLPGKQAEWEAWVAQEMETLAAQDRLFAGRDHVHTAIYEWAWDSGTVDAISALDRGYPGAIVVADEHGAPNLDVAVSVGLRLSRTVISEIDPPAHDLVVGFCARDPLTEFAAHADATRTAGFASAFLAAVPGTDTHADDL